MEDVQNGQRTIKPEELRKRLLESEPVEFIKKFQFDHGLNVKGLLPALHFCDLLGLPRGEIYRSLKQSLHSSIVQRIPKLSQDTAVKLLMTSLEYIEDPSLNEVPMKLLEEYYAGLPEFVYQKLASFPSETLLRIPARARRRTWELHAELFDKHCDTLIEHYIADRNVYRTSHNMALALDVNARRAKTRPLQDAKNAIGGSDILFDRFTEKLRQRFAAKGEVLLCTLLTDLLMVGSVTDSKTATIQDVAHIVDNLKMKHSNDKSLGVAADGEAANRLSEIIDLLYQEVVRVRDGTLLEKKPMLVPPAPAPSFALPVTQTKKKSQKFVKAGSSMQAKGTKTVAGVVKALNSRLLKNKKIYGYFDVPVVEKFKDSGVPDDYIRKIAHPMDMRTILRKAHEYEYVDDLIEDLTLIRDNCVAYNRLTAPLIAQSGETFLAMALKNLNRIAPKELYRPKVVGVEARPDDLPSVPEKSVNTAVTNDNDSGVNDDEEEDDDDDEDYNEDDFDMDRPAPPVKIVLKRVSSAPLPNAPAPPPPLPSKPVLVKAAEAAMVLADPNTQHSLAKMMFDLIRHKRTTETDPLFPRQVTVITKLLWLAQLGEHARDIVAASINRKGNDLLEKGPLTSKVGTQADPLLHRSFPLYACFFENGDLDSGRLVEIASQSTIATEYLLRFLLLQIRNGNENIASEILRTVSSLSGHPGFRRGLAHVLKSVTGMLAVRKIAIESILLPHVISLQNTVVSDGLEFWEAHEVLASVIGAQGTLSLAKEGQFGPDGSKIAEYLRQALSSIPHELYLNSNFRTARQLYESVLSDDLFVGLRTSIGLPVVPSGSSSREMSPGSARPSPSPGTFRAQSASPSLYVPRSAGPQSASPSFGSPG